VKHGSRSGDSGAGHAARGEAATTIQTTDKVSISFTELGARECALFHHAAEASDGEGALWAPFPAAVVQRVASLCELIASCNPGEISVELFGDVEMMLMVLNASIFFEASHLQQCVCGCIANLLRASCASTGDLPAFREAFGVTNLATDKPCVEAEAACPLWKLQLQAEQTAEACEPCAAELRVGRAVVTGDALQICLAMCDVRLLEVLKAVSSDWCEAVCRTIRAGPLREPGWLPLLKYVYDRKEVLVIQSSDIYGNSGRITFADGSEKVTSAKEAQELVHQLGFKVTRRFVEHDRYYGGVEQEARPPEDPQAAAEPKHTCRPDDMFGCRCGPSCSRRGRMERQ